MTALIKVLLFTHFIAISVSNCASKSIGKDLDTDPRIFFFIKDSSHLVYSKLSNLGQSRILWTIGTEILSGMTLEYYSERKTLFWANKDGEVYSAFLEEYWNTDESASNDEGFYGQEINATLIYSEKNWYPKSMALDEVGKKLYVADTIERSIDVFDLNGQNKASIFTSKYVIPTEIVIDSNEGLLFLYAVNFVKRKTELHRMNMDGTDHRILNSNMQNLSNITLKIEGSLAIDRVNKKLFYRSSWDTISMVDYNGNGSRSVLNYDQLAHLEFYNGSLFWSRSYRYQSVLDNSEVIFTDIMFKGERFPLMSCDVTNQNFVNSTTLCQPIWKNELSLNYFNMFKIFDFAPTTILANPCLEAENSCEDHCLLKPSGIEKKLSYGCACRLGRKLNDDHKTCSDISQEKVDEELSTHAYQNVWYLYNEKYENVATNERNASSVYKIPMNLFLHKIMSVRPKSVWDDALNTVYKVSLRGIVECVGDSDRTVRSSKKIAAALGYDWVSKNLYYAKLSNSSDEKYNLFVIPTRHPKKEMFLAQINKPTSMAVHPYRGYLFVATFNENESHIVRFNTDGKDEMVLPYSSNTTILLTLDFDEDRLYWIDECSEGNNACIRSDNLDGGDGQLFKTSGLHKSNDLIIVYQEQIFVRTDDYELYAFNKSGVERGHWVLKDLCPLNEILVTKDKVKKTDTQYLSATNPCVNDNGGCEVFCFAVPSSDSKSLQKVCSN